MSQDHGFEPYTGHDHASSYDTSTYGGWFMPFRVVVSRKAKIRSMSFCRYFGAKGKNTKHVFLSLFQPSHFEAKTWKHDKQRATTRKISNRRHNIVNKEIFVPSLVKMLLFRLAYFMSSLFAFRGKDTTRNGINQPP